MSPTSDGAAPGENLEHLLDQIHAAAPDPLRLTDDDYGKLAAYLRTHRRRVSFSAQQKAARGDLAARARLEQDEARWAAWQCTLEYNRELRAADNAAAAAAALASAGSVTAPRKAASASKVDADADGDENLPLSARLAYYAYKYAEQHCERALTDHEAWRWLHEHGAPGEYELPNFSTWERYLRTARNKLGEGKYNRRHKRPTGRSIVRRRDL